MKKIEIIKKNNTFMVITTNSNSIFGKPNEICAILFNGQEELDVFHEKLTTTLKEENLYNDMIKKFSDFYLKNFSLNMEIVTHLNGFSQIVIFKDMYDNGLIEFKEIPMYYTDIANNIKMFEGKNETSLSKYASKWLIEFNFEEFRYNINNMLYNCRLIGQIHDQFVL